MPTTAHPDRSTSALFDGAGERRVAPEVGAAPEAAVPGVEHELVHCQAELGRVPTAVVSGNRDGLRRLPRIEARHGATDAQEHLTGDVRRQIRGQPDHEWADVAWVARRVLGVLV